MFNQLSEHTVPSHITIIRDPSICLRTRVFLPTHISAVDNLPAKSIDF